MAVHSPTDDVDRMIVWLEAHRAEICELRYGRVLFDLYGGEIKARLERVEKLPPAERISAAPV